MYESGSRSVRERAVSTVTRRDLKTLLGPAEAQYGEQVLVAELYGDQGPLACGSTIVDGDDDDLSAAPNSVQVGISWNDVSGETGYRQQFDFDSATFVTEDQGSDVAVGTTGTLFLISGGLPRSETRTFRVFAHLGHGPNHGGTPVAGDLVSNECTFTLVLPDNE